MACNARAASLRVVGEAQQLRAWHDNCMNGTGDLGTSEEPSLKSSSGQTNGREKTGSSHTMPLRARKPNGTQVFAAAAKNQTGFMWWRDTQPPLPKPTLAPRLQCCNPRVGQVAPHFLTVVAAAPPAQPSVRCSAPGPLPIIHPGQCFNFPTATDCYSQLCCVLLLPSTLPWLRRIALNLITLDLIALDPLPLPVPLGARTTSITRPPPQRPPTTINPPNVRSTSKKRVARHAVLQEPEQQGARRHQEAQPRPPRR